MKKLLCIILILLFYSVPVWATVELKQSTGVTVRVGPFIDKTDGLTPETGITLGAADEAELLKGTAGAATVDISGNDWSAITSSDGWYDLGLTASNTDTVPFLTIVIQDDSECLPVFMEFVVINADYYDTKYSGTTITADIRKVGGDAIQDNNDGRLEVNVEEWKDTAVNADTAGYPSVTIKDGTGTGEVDTDSGTVLLRSATETQIDNIETDTGTTLDNLVDDLESRLTAARAAYLDNLHSGVTTTTLGANVITSASINDGAISDVDVDNDVQVDVVTIETADATDQVRDSVLDDATRFSGADIANILTDTGTTLDNFVDDLESRLTAARAGYLDTLNSGTTVANLTANAKSEVNVEVVDVVSVDTWTQPGVGAPSGTTTLTGKIGDLHLQWRNKSETVSTGVTTYADDGSTKQWKFTHSDDGTTYTKGETGAP